MNRGALVSRAWYDAKRRESKANGGAEYRLLDMAADLDSSPEQLSKWLSGAVVPLIQKRARFKELCGTPLLDWDTVVHGRTEWRTDNGELILIDEETNAGAA